MEKQIHAHPLKKSWKFLSRKVLSSLVDMMTNFCLASNCIRAPKPNELSDGVTRHSARLPDLHVNRRSSLSIDASVKLMDHFNDASFYKWVKDQRNARTTATHLAHIMLDYTPERVADGLRWLFEDWQLINIAVVLRVMFFEQPAAAGRRTVVSEDRLDRILVRLTMGWQRKHVDHLGFLLRQPDLKLN